jgi:hypothetical protein
MKTKEEFVRQIEEIRAMLASGAEAQCNCPNVKCEFHGNCYDCIRIHRHYKDHLPRCMQLLIRDKVKDLARLVEFTVENIPGSPPEYWDHLNEVSPREKAGDS